MDRQPSHQESMYQNAYADAQDARMARLEKQRDALLLALKDLSSTVGLALGGSIRWDSHKKARQLIAEIEDSHD